MLTFRFWQMRLLMPLELPVVGKFLLAADIWANEATGMFQHMLFVLGFVGIFLHVCVSRRE